MRRLAVALSVAAAASLLPSAALAAAQPPAGAKLGRLVIRAIGLNTPYFQGDWALCKGDQSTTTNYGPAAYPCSSGNTVALAGHRTTRSRPFRWIDRLKPGYVIKRVTPGEGTVLYRVTGSRIWPSSVDFDTAVTGPPLAKRLVLTTCNPPGSDAQRLVVYAWEVPKRK